MKINKRLLELWDQIDPIVVKLKPGEKRQIGNWIVEKTEGGIILVYEVLNGDEED